MVNFNESQQKLALKLFEVGAIKFGAFKLNGKKSNSRAPLSPIYFDLRLNAQSKNGPLNFQTILEIGIELFDLAYALNLKFNQVAGISEVGGFIADAFANDAPSFCRRFRLLKFWKEKKDGKMAITEISEGIWKPQQVVLLIDDTEEVNPKIEAINVLERNELKVRDVLVVIDRGQGGKEILEEKGYNLYALFNAIQLIDFYLSKGKISKEKAKEVKEYIVLNK